jgi:hypothetical protein
MNIDEIYNRIGSFIILVINDPSINVIINSQNAPRSLKPCLVVAIKNFVDVDMPMKYEIDNLGLQKIVLNKSFIVTLETYCDRLLQAENILNNVHNYLRTEIAYNHFRGDISYMRTIEGVSTIPTAINGITESRAILEMEFITTQTIQDNVGFIDNIVINNETTGNNIIINR